MIGIARLKRLLMAGAIALLGLFLAVVDASANGSAATHIQPQNSIAKPAISEVRIDDLPLEARGTLDLIKKGGPFPYTRDGITFNNRENILPRHKRGYYHEYTVPTPGASNRGARRIIVGVADEYYYTDDHYRSFRRIKE